MGLRLASARAVLASTFNYSRSRAVISRTPTGPCRLRFAVRLAGARSNTCTLVDRGSEAVMNTFGIKGITHLYCSSLMTGRNLCTQKCKCTVHTLQCAMTLQSRDRPRRCLQSSPSQISAAHLQSRKSASRDANQRRTCAPLMTQTITRASVHFTRLASAAAPQSTAVSRSKYSITKTTPRAGHHRLADKQQRSALSDPALLQDTHAATCASAPIAASPAGVADARSSKETQSAAISPVTEQTGPKHPHKSQPQPSSWSLREASLREAYATADAVEAEGAKDMFAVPAVAPALAQSALQAASSSGRIADVVPERIEWRALPLPVHERQPLHMCQLTDLRAWHSAAASAAAATQDSFAADDGPTSDDLQVRFVLCSVHMACMCHCSPRLAHQQQSEAYHR